MLQPRLLLRQSSKTCTCLVNVSRRTYASIVEPPPKDHVEASVDTTIAFAPPPTRDEGNFAIRTYKPRTPGVRHLRRPINDHLWKGRPHFPLTYPKKGQARGGRNNSGKVTVRHRGGGHKRRIRTVDFNRVDAGAQKVLRIEHDPGRTAHIALLENQETGKKTYIVAAEGMREGDVVQSYLKGIPQSLLDSMGGAVDPGVLAARTAWRGNCLPLSMIPVGSLVYNVGSVPGGKAIFCRSAGTYATVIAKGEESFGARGDKYVTIRLQSGESRVVSKEACATVGVASNAHYQHRQLGKAGRKRWLGIRPTVRGVAMNASDHPHGGGRGKSKGNVHPVSIWGVPVCPIIALYL